LIESQDLKLIESLIIGDSNYARDKQWMFDIVNNKRNSIDVDKFDYI
jgi:hypothetical protein